MNYALQKIEEEYVELKRLSKKELSKKKMKRIKCPRCSEFVFLKEGIIPWIVKCPHCCDKKERPILKWLYIMNPNYEVFDECPSCNRYGFIFAKNMERYIEFMCKNCKERFFIFKKDAIKIE